jgi:hypothetical protein
VLTDEILRQHPLAVWTELAIRLEDGQELKRKRPIPFGKAVSLLSDDSGVDAKICRSGLEGFLTRISLPEKDRGGSGASAFLAFKLHQFISGAGENFTTLTEKPRNVPDRVETLRGVCEHNSTDLRPTERHTSADQPPYVRPVPDLAWAKSLRTTRQRRKLSGFFRPARPLHLMLLTVFPSGGNDGHWVYSHIKRSMALS